MKMATVKNFVMNDKCAAGTGRFLEMMAKTMEMSLDELSQSRVILPGRYYNFQHVYSIC